MENDGMTEKERRDLDAFAKTFGRASSPKDLDGNILDFAKTHLSSLSEKQEADMSYAMTLQDTKEVRAQNTAVLWRVLGLGLCAAALLFAFMLFPGNQGNLPLNPNGNNDGKGGSSTLHAEEKKSDKALEEVAYDRIIARHKDMDFKTLKENIARDRAYLEKISFDPTKANYFDLVNEKLKLTDAELEIFKRNGFVSMDQNKRHSFGSAYYHIYINDLPVYISSDSMLYALHKSYDEMLMELEETLFSSNLKEMLADCQAELAKRFKENKDEKMKDIYKDVDLYFTVGRNLLEGAGAPEKDDTEFEPEWDGEKWTQDHNQWDGKLIINSVCGNDEEVLARLKDIQSLKMQHPGQGETTFIYGGSRPIDYSQFKPRGHYTKRPSLMRYFRSMMWFGRADTGFVVLPADATTGVQVRNDRELRNAALVTELVDDSKHLPTLNQMDEIISFMVGKSDNLTVFNLYKIMDDGGITTLSELMDDKGLEKVRNVLCSEKYAVQRISSQALLSDPNDLHKANPPALFQLFGQRFVIDSFVLSKVVFDEIIYKDKKQERKMPAGLDVMAALGNPEAVNLLKPELEKWNYAANLMAAHEFVDSMDKNFWKENLYNIWLDSLRVLDEDMGAEKNFPECMRTKTWQMKQLQTQHASWSELRHDTILYAKESDTKGTHCEYPAGYVEPYPQFYAKLAYFADTASRLIKDANYNSKDEEQGRKLAEIKKCQLAFFENMKSRMEMLQRMAEKELKAEAFNEEEKKFIRKTIEWDEVSGGVHYDGWYCELFYVKKWHNDASDWYGLPGGRLAYEWDPTIADVHTDPDSRSALEVGVGDVNFGIFAIDNAGDKAVYVGPLYSYYEFSHPVDKRLTDPEWQKMIEKGQTPNRPEWVKGFQAPKRK